MSSLNPYNLMRSVLLSNPFYRPGNRGTRNFSDCLDSLACDHTTDHDKNEIRPQAVCLRAFQLSHGAVSIPFFYSLSFFLPSRLLKFPTYKSVRSHTCHSALAIIYSWPISFSLHSHSFPTLQLFWSKSWAYIISTINISVCISKI